MIAHLAGSIIFRGSNYIILGVSGVGYKVFCSLYTLKANSKIGAKCGLYIHTHVRENSLDLYGFTTLSELNFFEMLIGVSGIGPKSALGVFALAPIDTLKRAIASGEIQYLTRISGIGKKTAEKMIVELREKLSGCADVAMDSGDTDVLDALVSLGYSVREAREAVQRAANSGGTVDEKIRTALKTLGS